MRLASRRQLIAGIAVIAGALLLVATRFFVTSQSATPAVATIDPLPRDALPSQQSDDEVAAQAVVAPTAPRTKKPTQPTSRVQTLTGRVYDEATSVGIAAATLSFRDAQVGRYDGDWRSRPRFKANEDGSFRLDEVPPGRIMLEVSKVGYASRELYIGVAADKNAPLEIALSAGAAISGRLTAVDTVTPVVGHVALENLDEVFGLTVNTGSAGEFSFTALAPGSYRLTGHGNNGFVEREISLAAGQRIEDLLLALDAGGTVRGTVTGVRAQELAGTTVSILRHVKPNGLLTARPDGRGNYVLTGVPGGSMSVLVDTTRRSRSRRIELPAEGDITVDFDFPNGSHLSGRALRRGKPLAGVTIDQVRSVEPQARLHAVKTSANGEYAFEDLQDGEHYFSVGGYFAPPVRIAGNTVFDFEVPSLTVSGTVVDGSRQQPIAWASVFVVPAPPGNPARAKRVETNAFGKFSFDTAASGDYVVTIYKPGYEMIRKRVSVGAADADLPIVLNEDEGVRIRMRTADDTPIRFVFLSAQEGNVLLLRGFPLRLDERGEGYLPRAFVGSQLQFDRDDASLSIPRWNGDVLDLKLAPEGAR